MNIIKKHKSLLSLLLVLLILCGVYLNASRYIDPRPANGDAMQNLAMAYNKFKYGVLSDSTFERPDVSPTYRREPLYPLMLANVMKLVADPATTELSCLLEAKLACQTLLGKLQSFNIVLLLALSVATLLGGRVIMGRGAAPYIAFLLVGFSPHFVNFNGVGRFNTELPAALALLIGSICLYMAVSRTQWLWYALGAGVAFGALILIKAVFFYFGVVLGLVTAVFSMRRRSWNLVKSSLVILLVTYTIAGFWMMRNYTNFGTTAIAGRDGEVLAIRAEFSTMTWPEYRASFLAYTPIYGQPLLDRFFDPKEYLRFDNANPDGFYRKVKNRNQMVSVRGINESALKRKSIALIKENWFKHLALTATFAYRGSLVSILPISQDVFETIVPNNLFLRLLCYILLLLLGFVSLFVIFFGSIKRNKTNIIFFLLPTLYSYAIHAVATHYIPRYSYPLIPCLVITTAMLLEKTYKGCRYYLTTKYKANKA
jgi:4-amino-4-deoxy-L-arabinose transferase-like glycosyltransferase